MFAEHTLIANDDVKYALMSSNQRSLTIMRKQTVNRRGTIFVEGKQAKSKSFLIRKN
jgi:hypothetical protein